MKKVIPVLLLILSINLYAKDSEQEVIDVVDAVVDSLRENDPRCSGRPFRASSIKWSELFYKDTTLTIDESGVQPVITLTRLVGNAQTIVRISTNESFDIVTRLRIKSGHLKLARVNNGTIVKPIIVTKNIFIVTRDIYCSIGI